MQTNRFVEGARAAIPTAFGYLSIGLAFGLIAGTSGFTVVEVAAMSVLIYGGSAQFALVAMLVDGSHTLTILLTIFLINLRNMLLGIHAASILSPYSLGDAVGVGSLLTDESYGVLLSRFEQTDSIPLAWMHGNNVMSYMAWCVSTVMGTALASFLPNVTQLRLDYALVAMFIGIFSGQYRLVKQGLTTRKIGVVLGTVGMTYFFIGAVAPSSVAVLVATLAGCGMGGYVEHDA